MNVQVVLYLLNLPVDLRQRQLKGFAIECFLIEFCRFAILGLPRILQVLLQSLAVLAADCLKHQVLQHNSFDLLLDFSFSLVGEGEPEEPHQLGFALQFEFVDQLRDTLAVASVDLFDIPLALLRVDVAIEAHPIGEVGLRIDDDLLCDVLISEAFVSFGQGSEQSMVAVVLLQPGLRYTKSVHLRNALWE